MAEFLRAIDQNALALVGVAVVAGVFGLLQNRKTRRSIEDRIGTPNGQGNVIEMQETGLSRLVQLERIVLRGQSEQDKRIARLEQADVAHDRTLDRHDQRIRALETTPKEGP